MYILPQPREQQMTGSYFLLDYTAYLAVDPACSERIHRQAFLLRDAIEKNTGYCLHLTRGEARKGDIQIGYLDPDKGDQYYELSVTSEGVMIRGTETSIFYGMQTLIQIVEQSGAKLPGVEIKDFPALPHRGFYHDMTRGRSPTLACIKKLADKMARYKMNELQLYMEHTYLFRDFSEVWRDDDPMGPEEILELDAYCRERGIELVPSISTCSHLYKLLRTKQWKHLCELDDPDREPFNAWAKMAHHTIDISNGESMELVKKMLREFRPLFYTKKFNICGDETFDLGKGKSASYCKEKGLGNAYVEFVSELCRFVKTLGCQPMMWGDVVSEYPDMLDRFPEDTIFLNWGYDGAVSEESTKIFGERKVTFYNCPGVSGWSRLCNDYKNAYENIRRMAEYAKANQGVGLLNTDWGDFYHTVHPEFSFIGMIYGAQFAWGDSMEKEELNQAVSVLEFGRGMEGLTDIFWKINENSLCNWMNFPIIKENRFDEKLFRDTLKREFADEEKAEKLESVNKALLEVKEELSACMKDVTEEQRKLVAAYILAADGCRYWNELATFVHKKEIQKQEFDKESAGILAANLEQWFYYYKRLWRTVSRESELYRIQELVGWYCDYLRD